MATELSISPNERGTMLVTVGPFKDAEQTTVTPSAVSWSLRDRSGAIVNSRSNVAVTPASTIEILLAGADLAIDSTYASRGRTITIAYTYTSDLGAGLVDYVERTFTITPLAGVSS